MPMNQTEPPRVMRTKAPPVIRTEGRHVDGDDQTD
jgi:hypothetical protein